MTTQDLGFAGAEVWTVAFQPGSVRLWFREGGTYLEVSGVWRLRWPDGSSSDYDARLAGRDPQTARLLDALAESRVVDARAELESSVLDVVFDSGLELHFASSGAPQEEWTARNRDDRSYIASSNGELNWYPASADRRSPSRPTPEPEPGPVSDPCPVATAGADAVGPRVIDLEITGRLYGVTVFGTGVRLETRTGSIHLAGPFTVTDADGERFVFDPEKLIDDTVAGAILAVLIDHRVESATLRPDTSEVTVTLAGGGRLDWTASKPDQAQLSAKNLSGREFWSRGDGTVYWYGGPAGTRPRFLVGGPKESE